MKQVAQNKKSGELAVVDVPVPSGGRGMILVKNYFSVISAGTEKTTLETRRSSLLQRARSQPRELKSVIDEAKRTGIFATYKRVMSKLDSSAPMGYSSAGIVLAADPDIQDIRIGDRVACAGAEYAFHSDVIAVPRNLAVRVPEGVTLEAAAYTTLGAIALQGIRQAEPTLGETVAVIGLGLLGLLAVELLKANGCTVVGIDLDDAVLERARECGIDAALHRSRDNVAAVVGSLTGGHGADAVLITAGTKSNDPIELAGILCREKGRVVVVGGVPMDIPRAPFYAKEIDIRLSRSYGPGRYDAAYEKNGVDYPIGYVRWTENRNMQAFLSLAAARKVNPARLTTHRFPIERAEEAYALVETGGAERYIGILLSYGDLEQEELRGIASQAVETRPLPSPPPRTRNPLHIGFIGLGSFASGYLMPPLAEEKDLALAIVCNQSGLTSMDMQKKFGFGECTTDVRQVMCHATAGTVFIATRHGLHAPLAIEALRNGLNVFVEKPLALTRDELARIAEVRREFPEEQRPLLMVGYNRRFAPLVAEMKKFFSACREPALIHYRVNAGFIPKDSWIQDPFEGGGRIVGEVCHFIDTIQFLTGAHPVRLHADSIRSANEAVTSRDTLNVTLRMEDGSLGVITYAANGDASVPKERIEMHCGSGSAILDNFTSLLLAQKGSQRRLRGGGDKGHRAEVAAFAAALRSGAKEIIPFDSLLRTSEATFAVVESLAMEEPVSLTGSAGA